VGFWRIKRWERGIVASQREVAPVLTPEESTRDTGVVSQFEHAFGLGSLTRSDVMHGLGLGQRARERERDEEEGAEQEEMEGMMDDAESESTQRARRVQVALAHEARLQDALRAAGLL